ncbi:MAG: 50S ribosomal protein L9 [Gammaproteobacteria bacterium RIFCSPLOWO2_02_FULL_38_11]|nr:MAG: 50S ribosomal protein L9 [Gammaproteobacteria bacterium RIFCSPLOWO2_02_FULL_38_11]
MNVILLEKIRNLGSLGEQVSVKPGFARNYLYPKRKAVPATGDNLKQFEEKRAELEKIAQETLQCAQDKANTITSLTLTIPAKAGEEGKLFGSIGPRDISQAFVKAGIELEKSAIQLPQGPLRQLGEYEIQIILHTDVATTVKISIVPEA